LSASPKPSAPPAPAYNKKKYRHPDCPNPQIGEDNGAIVCFSCGLEFERLDIVSEITFGETASGAAMVQGGLVGRDQRHANTMGGTVAGIGGPDSRQNTEMNGKNEIWKLCSALGISDRVKDQAFAWYKLASGHNFVQGRRIRNVAAVAIYLAARKQPQNTLMLMDLSEKIQVNVWALGDTYKQFCRTIMEEDPAAHDATAPMEIEPLMLKFCRKLEFDTDSHRIANDACLILRRMRRDWMVQGRNPAGICGACIILAAHMNGFRRTVREVVYVVKVADTTINQRLYEYRRTESSNLTVAQFREFGDRLKVKINPPSVYKRAEKEQKLKRKAEILQDESINASGDETGAEDSPRPPPTKRTKRQAILQQKQGMKNGKAAAPSPAGDQDQEERVPDVDALTNGTADVALDALAHAAGADEVSAEAIAVPKRRGRPSKKSIPYVVTPEDLEVESALQEEIDKVIFDWESTFKEFNENGSHAVLVKAQNRARQLAEQHAPTRHEPVDTERLSDLDDDPDVRNAILDEDERPARERLWLTLNEDWLREQAAKNHAKAMEEAQGKPKKPKQKRKHVQMGDGSVLEGRPAADAAEAAKKMIEKRAKHFSSNINYDVYKSMLGNASTPSSAGATPTQSEQAATPVGEPVLEDQPAPIQPTEEVEEVEEVEEAEEEDDYEEEQYQDEEDLEHMHDYEDDEGFGDTVQDFDIY